jgi:hypothetical protein
MMIRIIKNTQKVILDTLCQPNTAEAQGINNKRNKKAIT